MSLISNLLIGTENYQIRDYWLGMCARSNTEHKALVASTPLVINTNFNAMTSNSPAFTAVPNGIKVANTSMYILIFNLSTILTSAGHIEFTVLSNNVSISTTRWDVSANLSSRYNIVVMATLQKDSIINCQVKSSANGTFNSVIMSMLAMAPITSPVPVALNDNESGLIMMESLIN